MDGIDDIIYSYAKFGRQVIEIYQCDSIFLPFLPPL